MIFFFILMLCKQLNELFFFHILLLFFTWVDKLYQASNFYVGYYTFHRVN